MLILINELTLRQGCCSHRQSFDICTLLHSSECAFSHFSNTSDSSRHMTLKNQKTSSVWSHLTLNVILFFFFANFKHKLINSIESVCKIYRMYGCEPNQTYSRSYLFIAWIYNLLYRNFFNFIKFFVKHYLVQMQSREKKGGTSRRARWTAWFIQSRQLWKKDRNVYKLHLQ